MERARQRAGAKPAVKSVLTERQRGLIKEVSKDPLQTYRKTEKALTLWRKRKKELEEHNIGFKSRLDVDQMGTVGKLDPFLLSEMLKAADFVDEKYVEDLLIGFPVTGIVPCEGTGTPTPGGGERQRFQPNSGPSQELITSFFLEKIGI